MEKEYYSIVKKYNVNPFTSGLMTPCFCNFYHGYIFRKDEDGPSLIYDAVYTSTQQAQDDLTQVALACDIGYVNFLGAYDENDYKSKMSDIFHA